ncbi:MAG: WYL domain-containing protein [Chitinophagales bacterium]|nr:WYL domain-containing protein [Chitinophagales bacterium]MDW8419115.1 WYL domain-containing protein [Chitinophagales bacterium]
MYNPTYSRRGEANKQMHYSPNLLSSIHNAIHNCFVSTIEYDSKEKGISVRDIEPMAIVYKERRRHLVAWCHLRNDYRSFRLDRLVMIKLKKEKFTRRQDFDPNNFQDGLGPGTEEVFDDEN